MFSSYRLYVFMPQNTCAHKRNKTCIVYISYRQCDTYICLYVHIFKEKRRRKKNYKCTWWCAYAVLILFMIPDARSPNSDRAAAVMVVVATSQQRTAYRFLNILHNWTGALDAILPITAAAATAAAQQRGNHNSSSSSDRVIAATHHRQSEWSNRIS